MAYRVSLFAFIVILLSGCGGSSEPDVSVLDMPGRYLYLSERDGIKSVVIREVYQSNEKFEDVGQTVIVSLFGNTPSTVTFEKCGRFIVDGYRAGDSRRVATLEPLRKKGCQLSDDAYYLTIL